MGEFLRSTDRRPDLCEPAHEVSQSLRVWTLQLLDDLETLVQLSKHIHHRTGKESVLRSLLELSPRRKETKRKMSKREKKNNSTGPLNEPPYPDLHRDLPPKALESSFAKLSYKMNLYLHTHVNTGTWSHNKMLKESPKALVLPRLMAL